MIDFLDTLTISQSWLGTEPEKGDAPPPAANETTPNQVPAPAPSGTSEEQAPSPVPGFNAFEVLGPACLADYLMNSADGCAGAGHRVSRDLDMK